MEEALMCYYTAIPILITLTLIKLIFFNHKKQNLPPSPLAFPIIGHLHFLNLKNPLHHSLCKLSERYGPILWLKFGSVPVLVVSSLDAIDECFTKNDIVFANRPRTMASDHLSYDHTSYVWAPYGHLWRNLRRLTVIEVFSSRSISKSSFIREEEVCSSVRRVFKGSLDCDRKQKVDLKFLFSVLTINVIMKLVFGWPCVPEDVVGTETERNLVQDFKDRFESGMVLNLCDYIPVLRWIGYKGIEKSVVKLRDARDESLERLVDEVRSKKIRPSLKQSGEDKRSLAEILLALQESEPEFFTDKVVKATIIMLLIAGTTTSTATLGLAMSLLLSHPESLKKLRSEIEDQVGHDRVINETDLPKLPYLRCIVDETLRLHPPAPTLLPHFSSDACTVGGYTIPQGTMLMVNAWAVHRDPRHWEMPNEFRPERFEGAHRDREFNSKFLPFGTGRRACPGANIGLHIVSLGLGAMVQCFEWESVGADRNVDPQALEVMCSPRKNMVQVLSHL